MSIFKNKAVQLILFVGFGILLLYLVYANQRGELSNAAYFKEISDDLKSAKLGWIIVSLLIYMLSNVIRALRWQMLFKPMNYTVSFANAFFSTMVGYMVNLGLPRAGEVAKIAALARNENIPVEKVAGTIVVDRTLDVICLLGMILLGIALEYDAIVDFLRQEGRFDFRILGLLIFPLIGFLWFMKIRKTSKIGIIKKINGLFLGFADGIMSVFRMNNKWLFIVYSVLIWLCYYLMTYVVFFSYPPTAHLAPSAGLVVFVFGALGMVIPSPGGAGTYHYLIAKGLGLYGVTSGFVLANIIFIPIQVLCNIGFGILAYAVLPSLKKNNESKITDQA